MEPYDEQDVIDVEKRMRESIGQIFHVSGRMLGITEGPKGDICAYSTCLLSVDDERAHFGLDENRPTGNWTFRELAANGVGVRLDRRPIHTCIPEPIRA